MNQQPGNFSKIAMANAFFSQLSELNWMMHGWNMGELESELKAEL